MLINRFNYSDSFESSFPSIGCKSLKVLACLLRWHGEKLRWLLSKSKILCTVQAKSSELSFCLLLIITESWSWSPSVSKTKQRVANKYLFIESVCLPEVLIGTNMIEMYFAKGPGYSKQTLPETDCLTEISTSLHTVYQV